MESFDTVLAKTPAKSYKVLKNLNQPVRFYGMSGRNLAIIGGTIAFCVAIDLYLAIGVFLVSIYGIGAFNRQVKKGNDPDFVGAFWVQSKTPTYVEDDLGLPEMLKRNPR